ncbi:hypothetical protein ACFYTS_27110 [Nocardia sp. NPDC004151]|uniref:hypothetical protein n=1 Tax=Nocardia sp. NPDC004151 TaxID=3364304 RepID=UPI0036B53571
MTQQHTIHHGIGIVRPTNDVDIVLRIETERGIPNTSATAFEMPRLSTAAIYRPTQ